MIKTPSIDKRLVAVSVVLIIAVGITVSAGWLKNSLSPRVVAAVTKHSSERTLAQYNEMIGQPFGTLTNVEPKRQHSCQAPYQKGIKLAYNCDTTYAAYFKLGQSSAEKEKTLKAVAAVEQKLRDNNYKAGSNGVTLTSLLAGTYEGKDYSPNAYYDLNNDKQECAFSINVAYSNPSQPAVSMRLLCNRTVSPLGLIGNDSYPL